MINSIKKKQHGLTYRILTVFIVFAFIFTVILPPSYAQIFPQTLLNLPAPGSMLSISNTFAPTIVRGVTIYPDNPLKFDFIIDTGDENLAGDTLNKEARKLIKYFLASLTVPEDELWVNLSPYERDRIIPDGLGATEMGVDLLAQDYILKQLTASLIYPENDLGSKFWQRVYEKARKLYGTTDIPVNTFNKVWIVPDKAVVYEHEGTAFVVERHLKVMLEADYLALQNHLSTGQSGGTPSEEGDDKTLNNVSSEIIKKILIPEIEKEVNEGKNFANLRQIYNSMILATWYKKKLRESLLGQIYIDKNRIKGIDVEDKEIKRRIYDQYIEAFKKGVYNYIKEDYDPLARKTIPRKYFSGGLGVGVVTIKKLETHTGELTKQPRNIQDAVMSPESKNGKDRRVTWTLVENIDEEQLVQALAGEPASSPIRENRDSAVSVEPPGRIPVVLVTGMPGSGKGTVGPELANNLGVPHISLGEILRIMWKQNPEIPKTPGLGAKKLIEILRDNRELYGRGFILDSNPISLESQQILEDHLLEEGFYISKVVNIQIEHKKAKERFLARGTREGDKESMDIKERFEKRLLQHRNVVEPLVKLYAAGAKVLNIDNNGNLSDLEQQIEAITHLLKKDWDKKASSPIENGDDTNLILKITDQLREQGWDENEVRDKYLPLAKDLIDLKNANPQKRLTVGISGPSGAGKSQIARLLNTIIQILLGPETSTILKQDAYFMTTEEIKRKNIKLANPDSINVDKLNEAIDRFKRGRDIVSPVLTKTKVGYTRIGSEKKHANDILFVEGVYILNQNIPAFLKTTEKLDLNIFIDASGELIRDWWIDREYKKDVTSGKEHHESKWEKDLSVYLSANRSLWSNADVIIRKDEGHKVINVFNRSPFAKGRSVSKINELTVNSVGIVREDIKKLRDRVESVRGNDRDAVLRVVEKLEEVYHDLGIGWIDVLAKNDKDYVIGFADKERQQIGLVPEFFKTDGVFFEDLEKVLFYFGYMLAFPSDYQAVDGNYIKLQKVLFDTTEVISINKVKEFVRFSSKPKEVLFNPMDTAQMRRLDQYEGKANLMKAKQIAERIRQDNGGKMPTVAFLTPTGKGGGVSVLVKDIAEVLSSKEIGVNCKWFSSIRHENIDYWGASGQFQGALMNEKTQDLSEENIKRLDGAMINNINGLDLAGVDYIFMHEPYTLGMIPYVREKYPNIKIIWFNHGDLSAAPTKEIAWRLLRKDLSAADATIFSWMKEYIPEGDLGSPVLFMIHGINREITKNIPLDDRFIDAVAEKYGIDRDRPILLHVGRYSRSKDPLRSIAAYLKLKERIASQTDNRIKMPQLVVVGIPLAPIDWKFYKSLRKFVESLADPDIRIIASDNVVTEFTDKQIISLRESGLNIEGLDSWEKSDLELNALQRMATIGIHPARNEGFGLVISEALIKGTPVVASNIGGIPMQITDTRFLVDLPEEREEEVNKRYKLLYSANDYSELMGLMMSDRVAEMFEVKIFNALTMDHQARIELLEQGEKSISSEYSILRSLVGHLELIEVLGLLKEIETDGGSNAKVLSAMDRLVNFDRKYVPIIVRQLKTHNIEAQNRLIEVLRRMGDTKIDNLFDDIQRIKTDDGSDFDSLFARMKKISRDYPSDYIPVIIRQLDEPNKKIQRNFITLLTLMGENITEDLINLLEDQSIPPYFKRGVISVLVKIGVMGNENIRKALVQYIKNIGLPTDEKSITRAGFSYAESLGDLAEVISGFNHIKLGETIAGLLISNSIYPTENLVAGIANNEHLLDIYIKRFNEIREKQNFNVNDPIDLDLGYSLIKIDAAKEKLKFDLSYDEYMLWVEGKQAAPVLEGASSLNQKHLEELKYLAYESVGGLENAILKTAKKAHQLNRPFIVIGNNTYGGQIALAPIYDSLAVQDIKVLFARVASGNAHLTPLYVPFDMLKREDLRFILHEKPILFIVDGTNSLRWFVLEGDKLRIRQPHFPDSYMGYRNYFLALNEALGLKTNPEDFLISEEIYRELRQTEQYRRLVAYLKELSSQEYGKNEGTYSYKFSFWNASQIQLPIRQERQLVGYPISRNIDGINGPEIIFAQSVMTPDELGAQGDSRHVPGYFDISFQELGFRNFDFELYADRSGPHLQFIREKNIKSLESFGRKIRFESLIKKGQTVLNYFSAAKANKDSVRNPGAILLLGNHEVKTALSFIDYYKGLQAEGREPPIVISGGVGRGTYFLRKRIKEYFEELGEGLPENYERMSEAQLNKSLLVSRGIPESKIYLEERASNSFENFVFSKPIFRSLIEDGIIPPKSVLAVFQTPTQTLRAQDIGENILKNSVFADVKTISAYPLDLSRTEEEEFIVTLFRTVGLRSKLIEGEIPIFDQFNKEAATRIPDNMRQMFSEVETEFDILIDLYPDLFKHIEGFFSSTHLTRETVESLVQLGGGEIRSFLGQLAPYANDPQNSPFNDIAHLKNLWNAAKEFRDNPSEFSNENLRARESYVVPRIEVRGLDVASGEAAQVALIGIPGDYRDSVKQNFYKIKDISALSIRKGGLMTIEFNVSGINKSLAIDYVDQNFDELLDKIGYTEGEFIDARKTKTVIFADGDGTTYGKPTADTNPKLVESQAHAALLEYLNAGGVYIVISGNDIELTKERILGENGIPNVLRNRVIIVANGGASLIYFNPEGEAKELTGYKYSALIKRNDNKVHNLDAIYMGDDVDPNGNDIPVISKMGSSRFISVAPLELNQMQPELQNGHIGANENGVKAVLETVIEYAKNHRYAAIFGPKNLDAKVRTSLIGKTKERIHSQGKSSSPVGGINLDPAMLDLQIKRDNNGVPLPLFQQPVGNMRIDGFSPAIINISPINIPMLLGITNKIQEESTDGLSFVSVETSNP